MAVEGHPVPRVPGMARGQDKKTIGPTPQEARDANEGKLAPTGLENVLQRLARSWGVRLGLTTAAVGGGAYAAYQNVPAIHEAVNGLFGQETAVTVPLFDLSKLDQGPQTLVVGQNAREATQEEIQTIINSPLPELRLDPKTLEDIPTISIVPSIDLSKAGKVEVTRKKINGIPMNLIYNIENYGTPLGIFIPEGINTDTVEIFLLDGASDIYYVIEKFDLGNNRYLELDIGGNHSIADDIKNAPIIDLANFKNGNFIQDFTKTTGLKFKIKDNPTLVRAIGISEKSMIVVTPFYIDGNNGNAVPISVPVQDGNLLFSVPKS